MPAVTFDAVLRNPSYLLQVEGLHLGTRAKNRLENVNIVFIAELIQRTKQQIEDLIRFGRKSKDEVKTILIGLGLELETEIIGRPADDKIFRDALRVAAGLQPSTHYWLLEISRELAKSPSFAFTAEANVLCRRHGIAPGDARRTVCVSVAQALAAKSAPAGAH